MRWSNDYGDVPGWYWQSAAFQLPRAVEVLRRHRRARAAMAAALALVSF